MTRFLTTIFMVLFLAGGAARAQQAWLQIEALPTLANAEDRARAWGSAFPDVNGFRLASGWYAIVLGPYDAATAANRLFALRSERLVPNDSFVSDGGNYRGRFWPVGAGAVAPPGEAAGQVAGRPEQSPQAPAAQPPAATSPVPPALPDETPAQARRSEAALSADERMRLQTALQWFGFYDSAIDGAFGRGTRSSMAAWQGTNGYDATGVLTTRQRAALVAAYEGELRALGLGHVIETRAGIEIEMPIDLVEFDAYAPPFVRYREKNGSGVQVLLISQDGSQAALDGLYDAMQTLEIVPLQGFRERQGTSFTLTGQNDSLHSYSYARLEGGMIKGFSLIYPPEAAPRMTRAAEIMRDTLKSVGAALDPTLGADAARQSRDLMSGLEIRQAERTRSGVYVDGQGAVLTVAEAVAGCARVTLDDLYDARVVATDAGSGLALLRPDPALAPARFAALAQAEPRIGTDAAVAGFSFGSALPAASLTFGKVEDVRGLSGEAGLLRLSAETEPGDAGGPVFDPSGSLAGVLLAPGGTGGRELPPGVRFAAKADVVSAFLAAQGIHPPAGGASGAMAPEDITRAAMGMTVLVSCWN